LCYFCTFGADAKAPTFAKQGAESIVRTIAKVTIFAYFFKKVGKKL